jgi:predicted GNAT family acetyltransferase
MAEIPLDNPAWWALNGPHTRLAVTNGVVRRYHPDAGIFAAYDGSTLEALAALGALLTPGSVAAVLRPVAVEPPEGLAVIAATPLLQMVGPKAVPMPDAAGIVQLTTSDVPEMRELVALTHPGPFGLRTIEMGNYFGIRVDGKLAAMAGERMRFDGFTEVSAVCTHPDFTRRGYASALVRATAAGITARGETPFLHVLPGNSGAIATYERVGFSIRRALELRVLTRPKPGEPPVRFL